LSNVGEEGARGYVRWVGVAGTKKLVGQQARRAGEGWDLHGTSCGISLELFANDISPPANKTRTKDKRQTDTIDDGLVRSETIVERIIYRHAAAR